MMNWYVYIIYCSDDSFYTGISNDVDRRIKQHASLRGAKYFRGRKPRRLVYLESGHTRSTASRREAAIKKLSKKEKIQLLDADSNEASVDPSFTVSHGHSGAF
jgi:putative endonuclease